MDKTTFMKDLVKYNSRRSYDIEVIQKNLYKLLEELNKRNYLIDDEILLAKLEDRELSNNLSDIIKIDNIEYKISTNDLLIITDLCPTDNCYDDIFYGIYNDNNILIHNITPDMIQKAISFNVNFTWHKYNFIELVKILIPFAVIGGVILGSYIINNICEYLLTK